MFTPDEIRNNLTGAFQVMKGDPDGMNDLDTSVEGFWRSFGALILIVPVIVLSLLADKQLEVDVKELAGSFLPVPVLVFLILIDWILFPALMALASRPLGLANQYVPFIVARNWASVLASALSIPPLLLYLAGVLPVMLLILFSYAVLMLIGFFSYRIARTALMVSPGLAVGVAAAEIGLSILLRDVARVLLG